MNIQLRKVFLSTFVFMVLVMGLSAQAASLSHPLQNWPRINAWFDADGSVNGYDYRYDGTRILNTLYYSSWAPSGYNYYYDGHKAIDFAASTGTQVYAAAPGDVYQTVSYCNVGDTQCGNGYGNHVRIRHFTDQSVTIYAHLSSADVSVSDFVDCGSPIGKSGNTGNSSGPHLHFEYRSSTYGTRLDPFNYWYQTAWVQDALNQYSWMRYPTTTCL